MAALDQFWRNGSAGAVGKKGKKETGALDAPLPGVG